MPSPPPPPPPPPATPTLQQLIQDFEKALTQLIKFSIPLIEDAYVFSQVLGHILVQEDNGQPPSTYYIGDPDPSSPTTPGTQDNSGQGYTHVATLGDPAAGWPIQGVDLGIYAGPNMSSVAFAVGSPGNWTILGGSGLPLAGVGSSSMANGAPIMDQFDESVQMSMPISQSVDGKHTLYTVGGTASVFNVASDNAFPQMLGTDGDVLQWYDWQPIDYPAATFPMGPGVKQAVQNMVNQINATPGTFALCGYSQGAIATCKLWRDHIMDPNGDLHSRLGDIFAHVTFGNPMRCPGIANGNGLVPIPIPVPLEGYVTGGIAGPDDLTPWQVPTWQMDFAHDGDVWASAPVGADPWHDESPVGRAETSIYDIFMLQISGQDSILAEVGELLTNPIPNVIAIIEGLINIGEFFGAQNQWPHDSYNADGDGNFTSYQASKQFLISMAKVVPA